MGWMDDLYRTVSAGLGGGSVVEESDALPGRDRAIDVAPENLATGNPMIPPFPDGFEQVVLGLGCFWGAEKKMWELPGVWTTAVGYAGGWTPNPTYEEVCTGRTGHTEVVLVVFDPTVVTIDQVLAEFYEVHDPTQGMRQHNDVGTQYRSAIFATSDPQFAAAEQITARYQSALREHGRGEITTEIGVLSDVRSGTFYYAEDYHQQYLIKNPGGYDCHVRSGIPCPL